MILTSVIHALSAVYPPHEARAMARRVLEEEPLCLSQALLFTGKDSDLCESKQLLLRNILERLLKKEPLQYVLGHEYFCGWQFCVAPGVLIPRPETQDLVEWILADTSTAENVKILDACTGSGCIAISLKKALPLSCVQAVDLSDDALCIARQNAQKLQAEVSFSKQDILKTAVTQPDCWDVLVSNPPYIAQSESADMQEQVLNWEPSMALFVPDDDALCFYRALGLLGQQGLKQGGAIYLEINSRFGQETCQLLQQQGYHNVELRNDRFGLPRMVKAVK